MVLRLTFFGLGSNKNVMRVTKKTRSVRRKTQVLHYVFGSKQHEIDAAAANKLRSVRYMPVEIIEPESKKRPFGGSKEIAKLVAGNAIRLSPPLGGGSGRGGFALVKDVENYVDRICDLGSPVHCERPKKGRPPKKDGTLTMETYTVKEPLKDTYFSLPPWVGQFLSCIVELDAEEAGWAQAVAFEAAQAAAAVLEERSGYRVEGIALHPDAHGAFGFHLQYLTAVDGELLGRSADGKRGRKGLRLAGDVNLALHRFDAVEEVPGAWKKVVEERDYDDVAMDGPLCAAVLRMVEEKFGEPGLETLKKMSLDYVKDWKAGAEGKAREDKLKKEVERLTKENSDLRGRIEKLEKVIKRMGRAFSPGPEEPEI
jgi:hypothetical protein